MIQDKPWRTQCWALWILLSAAVLLPRPVSTLNSVSSGLPFAYNHSLAEAIARKIQWIGLLAHPRKLSNDQDDGAKDVARQHLESHFAFLQTGLLRAQQGHKLCVLEFNIGAVQAVIRKVLCALAPTQVAKCDRAKSTANVHGEVYALIQEMLGAVSLLYANRLEHKLATSAFPLLRRIVAAGIFQMHMRGHVFSTEEEGMVRHLFGLLYRMHLEATHARGALEFFHISKAGGTSMCQLGSANGCTTRSYTNRENCMLPSFQDHPRWTLQDAVPSLAKARSMLHIEDAWCSRWGAAASPPASCAMRRELLSSRGYNYYANEYVMHTQPLSTAPLPIQLFHKVEKQSTAGSRGGGKSRPSASRKLEVQQSQCVAPCAELVNVVVLRDPLQRMLSHLKHIVQVYSTAYCGTKFRQAYMSYMRAKMRRSRVKSRNLQYMPDGEHARHLHASEQRSGNEAAMEEDEGAVGAEAEDEHMISVRSGSYNVHEEEDEESLELLWAATLKASVGAGSSQQHEPAEAEDDDVSVLQYAVHADAGEHGLGSSSSGSHGPSGQQQQRRLGRRLTDTAADSAVAAGRCLFTREFNVSDAHAWRRLAPAVVDNYMTRALLGHRLFNAPLGALRGPRVHASVRARVVLAQMDVVLVLDAPSDLSSLLFKLGLGWHYDFSHMHARATNTTATTTASITNSSSSRGPSEAAPSTSAPEQAARPRSQSDHSSSAFGGQVGSLRELTGHDAPGLSLDRQVYAWGSVLAMLDAVVFEVGAVHHDAAVAALSKGQAAAAAAAGGAAGGVTSTSTSSTSFTTDTAGGVGSGDKLPGLSARLQQWWPAAMQPPAHTVGCGLMGPAHTPTKHTARRQQQEQQ